VNPGDFREYNYTDIYIADPEIPYIPLIFDTNENETVLISLDEGMLVKVTILTVDPISYQITYSNYVTSKTYFYPDFDTEVSETTFMEPTNRSLEYWEDYVANPGQSDYAVSIQGSYLNYSKLIPATSGQGRLLYVQFLRNWQTGWLTYHQTKLIASSGVIEIELELIDLTYPNTNTDAEEPRITPGFILLPVFLLLGFMVILRKKENLPM
jgi:hypothetical protein